MKKLCLLIACLMLLCSCSNQQATEKLTTSENSLHEVPAGLYNNVEKAEFNKFNSPASENGLAGTMVYVEGYYDEVTDVVINGKTGWTVLFVDEDDNKWLVLLDEEEFGSVDPYKELAGHQVMLIANYQGFSGTYELPSLYASTLYDKETGKMISSGFYDAIDLEEIYLNSDTENETSVEEETKEVEKAPVEETTESTQNDTGAIRPEIKEAIDSYETFVDEYCEFMKKYAASNGSDLGLLADYASYISKLADMETKMEKIEDEDLNTAEELYYSEVLLRCSGKLLKAAQ